jgi:hypothetical protein
MYQEELERAGVDLEDWVGCDAETKKMKLKFSRTVKG